MLHGRQLGRNRSLDGTILRKESEDQVQEGTKLHELGTTFEEDKAKLEEEIEKVLNSEISDADKREILEQLEEAIKRLQEQYGEEVTEKEKEVQELLEEQTEAMQEAADELERQTDSLRGVQMDAASTDASAAADAAEMKKKEFEAMKNEYVEKLKLQMEQAEIQQSINRYFITNFFPTFLSK